MAIFAFLKSFQISWKALLAAILALAVVCAIKWGYDYIEDLQDKVVAQAAEIQQKQGELNLARFERNIAEARATEMADAQAELSARLNSFNATRLDAETELARLRALLAKQDLEEEIANDAAAARDRLNARTRELNRLLEGASRF